MALNLIGGSVALSESARNLAAALRPLQDYPGPFPSLVDRSSLIITFYCNVNPYFARDVPPHAICGLTPHEIGPRLRDIPLTLLGVIFRRNSVATSILDVVRPNDQTSHTRISHHPLIYDPSVTSLCPRRVSIRK
jgi:hypothetical protein